MSDGSGRRSRARERPVWNRRHEHHRARTHAPSRHPSPSAPAPSRSTTSSRSPATGHPSCSTRPRSTGVAASRAIIEALAADPEPHYGISTGFGALATTFIAEDRRAQLQASLVRSHAAGSGAEVEREVVRALMLLRLSTLMTGRTGVRRETAETYAAILNAGITPVVREYGSLGCSGDLAPLAHCALVAMGEGEVRDADGEPTDAATALAAAGITPLRLGEKEGLALINGTDGMLGMLALAIDDLRMLLHHRRHRRRDERRGPLGTDAVFAADLHAPAPAARAGDLRVEPAAPARRLADRREPQGPRVHPRAGRVLAALRPAGARRRPRHARARGIRRRRRARERRRQPRAHARRPRRVERQLPRRAGRLRARLPRDRGGGCRVDERAAHRPVPRPRPATRACRRSSRTRSASTRA